MLVADVCSPTGQASGERATGRTHNKKMVEAEVTAGVHFLSLRSHNMLKVPLPLNFWELEKAIC